VLHLTCLYIIFKTNIIDLKHVKWYFNSKTISLPYFPSEALVSSGFSISNMYVRKSVQASRNIMQTMGIRDWLSHNRLHFKCHNKYISNTNLCLCQTGRKVINYCNNHNHNHHHYHYYTSNILSHLVQCQFCSRHIILKLWVDFGKNVCRAVDCAIIQTSYNCVNNVTMYVIIRNIIQSVKKTDRKRSSHP
jgi:hypothetical protein